MLCTSRIFGVSLSHLVFPNALLMAVFAHVFVHEREGETCPGCLLLRSATVRATSVAHTHTHTHTLHINEL